MYKKIIEYSYVESHPNMLPADHIAYRCRFCSQIKSKDDFKKKAHAVSEGIGNKSIITSYECDECNQRFADREENELGRLLLLYKALHGKSGKKGPIKMHGARFSYTEDKTFSAKVDMKEKQFGFSFELAPNGTLAPTFSVKNTINFRLVYRAFVKFALSVVPEDISHELEQGYTMLKEGKSFPSYKGAMILFHDEIKKPCIAIYKAIEEVETKKYFCTVDAYQMRFVIPLDFKAPVDAIPVELIGNLDIPAGVQFDWCIFDYSDESRELIQKEQPYHRV